MQVKQGMRSVEHKEEVIDVDLEANKKIAKKTKKAQSKEGKDLVLVSAETDGPRFDFALGVDEIIRGVRAQGNRMMFVIPSDKADRALQHTWVVSGKLIVAD